MKNNKSENVSQFYDQLVTEFDDVAGVMWCYMNPHPRPCFTPQLLNDLTRFLQFVRNKVSSDIRSYGTSELKYVVFGSYNPGVFSLGGDLRLFLDCIREADRERLTRYMQLSIEVMYSIYTNVGVPITTISLIRGNALGAGFEGALSCDYIVAEKGVQMGFPEVLFNMFPGMGAYSFLARRIDPAQVEKMILSGRIYLAEELSDLGIIDVITEEYKGVEGVNKFIKKVTKSCNTRKAVLDIRNIINPVSYDEMLDIGKIWVESSMSLDDRGKKVMSRLVRSQDRMTAYIEPSNNVIKDIV